MVLHNSTTVETQAHLCSQQAQPTEEELSVTKEADDLKGKSWYDADQEYRQKTCRLSITRILFACLLSSPESSQPSDSINIIEDDVVGNQKHNDEKGQLDVTLRLKGFMDDMMVDMEIRGCVALLSDGLSVIGVDAIDSTVSPLTALGFVELQSPSDAEDFVVKLSKNNDGDEGIGLRSIRILLWTDDCPCYEFVSSSPSFTIYRASPPHEEDDIDVGAEGPTTVVADIMKNLCGSDGQMADSSLFSKDNRREEDESVDNDGMIPILTGTRRKALPSAKRVAACAQSYFFPTIEEYIDIFCTPISQSMSMYLNLESDDISPILPIIDWDAFIRDGIVPGLNDYTAQMPLKNGLLNYDGRHNNPSVA